MRSTNPTMMLDSTVRQRLNALALDSITHGLNHGQAMVVESELLSGPLKEKRATFVTLHKRGDLRGCVGHLKAYRPLAQSVADNAFAAAFRDPRFNPLTASELSALAVGISVLSPTEPIEFETEAELVAKLRPGTDGLVLAEGHRSGTFLPSVWGSIPSPEEFLSQLKRKAGLASDYWSSTLTVKRYTTESW
ncbi:MAG: AmmeMemoRadiSam system protein A [Gammaproteobacteria bacterium]|nr:AmmeMemoRadiSam system protein A [Gammaproteobacteria bacterium]